MRSPMFCDPEREYAVKLGVIDKANKDAKGLPLTVRSVYILKPDKSVALSMAYPASTGRNFDEILRVIDSLQVRPGKWFVYFVDLYSNLFVSRSLQLTAEKSTATPADWKHGEDGKLSLHSSLKVYLVLFFFSFGPLTHVTIFPSSFLL